MDERRDQHRYRHRQLHGGNDIYHDDGSTHDDNCPCGHFDDDHGGNDIHDNSDLHFDDYGRRYLDDNRTDHDIAGDEHINHLVTSREHYDLDDTFHAAVLDLLDPTDYLCWHFDDAEHLAAVRAVYDAAAAVLGDGLAASNSVTG